MAAAEKPGRRERPGRPGQTQCVSADHDLRAREQHRHAKHQHRYADAVQRQIAQVAVRARERHEKIGGGQEQAGGHGGPSTGMHSSARA